MFFQIGLAVTLIAVLISFEWKSYDKSKYNLGDLNLDDMEEKLNEQIDTNVALSSQMSGFQRNSILSDVSWDLSEAAKEKLAGLSESVEFESESNFRQKLNILKESFVEAAPAATTEVLAESAEAPAPSAEEGMSTTMAAYVRGLGRTLG